MNLYNDMKMVIKYMKL